MKIWAHRGCSQQYPENTLLAFEKAIGLKNLAGIELDIQLTKDGEIAVIHDERVDRTTESIGFVRDYTLAELKKLHIYADVNPSQKIPAIEEVFDLIEPRLKAGMKLNIELKNSVYTYPGMEEKILDLVAKRGVEDAIIYSSFSAKSIETIKKLNPRAETGILDSKVSDCLYKLKGTGADALHPYWKGIDLPIDRIKDYTVRAYLSGHLYPEKPTGTKLDLKELESKGITDVFLNEPERYID
ncbi:MAG: glycerophosphodiester phosphodiesterase family protein [Lachnospiraceae bacterium]